MLCCKWGQVAQVGTITSVKMVTAMKDICAVWCRLRLCVLEDFCKQSPIEISKDLRFNICHTLSAPCHEDVRASVHKAKRITRLRWEERFTIQTPNHLSPLDKTWPRPTASMHAVTKRKIPSSAGVEPIPSKSLSFNLRNCHDIDEMYTSLKSLNSCTKVSTRLLFHRVLNRNKQP